MKAGEGIGEARETLDVLLTTKYRDGRDELPHRQDQLMAFLGVTSTPRVPRHMSSIDTASPTACEFGCYLLRMRNSRTLYGIGEMSQRCTPLPIVDIEGSPAYDSQRYDSRTDGLAHLHPRCSCFSACLSRKLLRCHVGFHKVFAPVMDSEYTSSCLYRKATCTHRHRLLTAICLSRAIQP